MNLDELIEQAKLTPEEYDYWWDTDRLLEAQLRKAIPIIEAEKAKEYMSKEECAECQAQWEVRLAEAKKAERKRIEQYFRDVGTNYLISKRVWQALKGEDNEH
jgi:hypothetical protein